MIQTLGFAIKEIFKLQNISYFVFDALYYFEISMERYFPGSNDEQKKQKLEMLTRVNLLEDLSSDEEDDVEINPWDKYLKFVLESLINV